MLSKLNKKIVIYIRFHKIDIKIAVEINDIQYTVYLIEFRFKILKKFYYYFPGSVRKFQNTAYILNSIKIFSVNYGYIHLYSQKIQK